LVATRALHRTVETFVNSLSYRQPHSNTTHHDVRGPWEVCLDRVYSYSALRFRRPKGVAVKKKKTVIKVAQAAPATRAPLRFIL
jgi:hypothetical protein